MIHLPSRYCTWFLYLHVIFLDSTTFTCYFTRLRSIKSTCKDTQIVENITLKQSKKSRVKINESSTIYLYNWFYMIMSFLLHLIYFILLWHLQGFIYLFIYWLMHFHVWIFPHVKHKVFIYPKLSSKSHVKTIQSCAKLIWLVCKVKAMFVMVG